METQYYTLIEKQDFFEIIENKFGELAIFIDARDGTPENPVFEFDGKKTGIFAAGVAFGTAGIKILTSKDAKKLYTNCTAAVLRAKACVMKTASAIQENAEDIYAEAQQINEDRAAAEEVVEDTADEAAEETEETTDFKEETEETEEGSEE